MDFLSSIGNVLWTALVTNDAWLYLTASFIGLYSNLYWTIKREKRKPTFGDLFDLAGQLPVVWLLAIVIDNSPLIALVIGITPDRVLAVVRNQVITKSLKEGVLKDMLDSIINSKKEGTEEINDVTKQK